jgi:hypothetical protein
MFMFLSTDSFSIQKAKGNNPNITLEPDDAWGGTKPIRRPYRGIQIKEDTYSTLSVRNPDGSAIPLISSSDTSPTNSGKGGLVYEYADYILQRVDDQRAEKQQIIETFGDPFVYFFGERPRIVTFSGLLVSTEDFNWRSQFWKNYDESFRGTQLVQKNARAYISYDTIIIEGYPLAASAVDSADEPYTIPFSLQMFVTGYYDWSSIGSTRFPGKDSFIDLDVLNRELEDQRSKFVSSSSKVRLKNLTAKPAGGIAAAIRSGLKAVNDVVSLVDGVTDAIHNVIGGRVVRVPIGAAGYYQNAGNAVVGAGSISSAVLSSDALGEKFDSATGQYKGVTGSVKLRMPSYSKYATPWTSNVDKGSPVGYIFENYDEYPTRERVSLDKRFKRNNLGRNKAEEHALELAARAKEYDAQLALYNQIAEAGGILGTLAEAVVFAKSAFGMVMTVAAIADTISDVVRTGSIEKALKQALGIQSLRLDNLFTSPIKAFENAFSGALNPPVPLEPVPVGWLGGSFQPGTGSVVNGIKVSDSPLVLVPKSSDLPVPAESLQDTGVTSKYSMLGRADKLNKLGVTSQSVSPDTDWIGAKSDVTYQQALEAGTEVDVGFIYNRPQYLGASYEEASYEEVYGKKVYEDPPKDLESLLKSAYGDLDEELKAYGTDIKTALGDTYRVGATSEYQIKEGQIRTAVEGEALTSAYKTETGRTSTYAKTSPDPRVYGEDMKSAIESTYRVGSKSVYKRTPESIAAVLRALYSTPAPEPEDTQGIIGVEDDDSEISPIL